VGEVSEKEGLNELQKKSACSLRPSPPGEEREKDEDKHEGRR
jgi:hypothetical protein